MAKLLPLSAALLLCVSVSQASLAQGRSDDKPGKGKGPAAEHAQGPRDNPGKGGGKDKDKARVDKAPQRAAPDRVMRDDRPEQRADRNDDRNRDRDQTTRVIYVPYRDYGVIVGCPPGLAKKNNGCQPPGQARKAPRVRYDYRWGAPNADYVHRYDDGYQYRYDRQGTLLGYVPALGGALAAGNLWPTQYRYDPAPPYQAQYYGRNQTNDYRYADGALYGVDPKTSTIQTVVALLTGQSASVGQPMPSGYDVYNVPYAYRSQYADTANAAYRYNDGAIYQLDPKTQVIQSVIQLLAPAI